MAEAWHAPSWFSGVQSVCCAVENDLGRPHQGRLPGWYHDLREVVVTVDVKRSGSGQIQRLLLIECPHT